MSKIKLNNKPIAQSQKMRGEAKINMNKLDYSVYVTEVNAVIVDNFVLNETWWHVKVRVYQKGFIFEGLGFHRIMSEAEDLAKKQALKLIGVFY